MSDDDPIRWLREVCEKAPHRTAAEVLATLREPLLAVVAGLADVEAWATGSGEQIPTELAVRLGDAFFALDALEDAIRTHRGDDR